VLVEKTMSETSVFLLIRAVYSILERACLGEGILGFYFKLFIDLSIYFVEFRTLEDCTPWEFKK